MKSIKIIAISAMIGAVLGVVSFSFTAPKENVMHHRFGHHHHGDCVNRNKLKTND